MWWVLLACGDRGEEGGDAVDGDADTDSDADSDADADADADSDADTDTHSGTLPHSGTGGTASTAETGLALRDGVYTGTLHVDAAESGIVVNYYACDDPSFTLTIDSTQSPAIRGTSGCQLHPGFPVAFAFRGDVSEPNASGDTATGYVMFTQPEVDPWFGHFVDDHPLRGRTAGAWQQGSAGFTWSVQFDVVR